MCLTIDGLSHNVVVSHETMALNVHHGNPVEKNVDNLLVAILNRKMGIIKHVQKLNHHRRGPLEQQTIRIATFFPRSLRPFAAPLLVVLLSTVSLGSHR